MFVAHSRFIVANGMEEEVRKAFRERPHLVDSVSGFNRMEVLSPADRPQEFWLFTYWSDEKCWNDWYHGHRYQDSHQGIPKGLKLIPEETEIRHFHLITQ